MSAWFKRFALHLAAAVGATGVFVAAAAVGASQNRQQVAVVSPPIPIVRTRAPTAERKPTVVVTPTATATAVATETPTTAPTPTSGGPASEPTTSPTSPPPRPAAQAKPQAPPPQSTPTSPPQDAQQDVAPPADQPPQTQSNAQPKPQAKPAPAATATPKPEAVVPERSLAGTIKAVQGDGLDVLGVGGREWHVTPAPGALIRLNGKTAKLDNLQVGQSVVILGQAQSGPGARFLAHAITAKGK